MQYLKADTAVKVVIGPVVAVGDGFTPITTLALGTADEAEILKHDAAAVTDISGNTFAAIASADGYYNLTISAAQLDTEGMLTVLINDDSLCLPVRHDFMVVNANVFDSLFAAATTDYLQVDQLQLGGDAQSTTDLKDFADAGYDPATNKVQGLVLADTVTDVTNLHASAATAAELAKVPKSDGTASWNATALAAINAEAKDVIATDTISELTAGVPDAEPTLEKAIMLMYMALRNTLNVKTSYTTDAMEVSNDAGTVIAHKDVTDDGSDYSEAKMQSGASS